MNLLPELDLFGNLNTRPQNISNKEARKNFKKKKRELQRIERAKLKKLGEANYFYPTTGKNCFHTDGFVNGENGKAHSGGYTVYKNGKRLVISEAKNFNGFTNNEAELLGVHYAIIVSQPGDEIVTDSMNTLSWVRSGNPKARPDLKFYAEECKKHLHLKKLNLYWRPRAENQAGNYNEFEK